MDPLTTLLACPPFLILFSQPAREAHQRFVSTLAKRQYSLWRSKDFVAAHLTPHITDYVNLVGRWSSLKSFGEAISKPSHPATRSARVWPALVLVAALQKVSSFTDLALCLELFEPLLQGSLDLPLQHPQIDGIFDNSTSPTSLSRTASRTASSSLPSSTRLTDPSAGIETPGPATDRLMFKLCKDFHSCISNVDKYGDESETLQYLEPGYVLDKLARLMCETHPCRTYILQSIVTLVVKAGELIRSTAGVDNSGTSGDRRSVRALLYWLWSLSVQPWEVAEDLIQNQPPAVLLTTIQVIQHGDVRMGNEVFKLAAQTAASWIRRGLYDRAEDIETLIAFYKSHTIGRIKCWESSDIEANNMLLNFESVIDLEPAQFLDSVVRILWSVLELRNKEDVPIEDFERLLVEIVAGCPVQLLYYTSHRAQQENAAPEQSSLSLVMEQSTLGLAALLILEEPNYGKILQDRGVEAIFRPLIHWYADDRVKFCVELPDRLMRLKASDLDEVARALKSLSHMESIKCQVQNSQYMEEIAIAILTYTIVHRIYEYFEPHWTQIARGPPLTAYSFLEVGGHPCDLSMTEEAAEESVWDAFGRAMAEASASAPECKYSVVRRIFDVWINLAAETPSLGNHLLWYVGHLIEQTSNSLATSNSIATRLAMNMEGLAQRIVFSLITTELLRRNPFIFRGNSVEVELLIKALQTPIVWNSVGLRPYEKERLRVATNVCLTCETITMIKVYEADCSLQDPTFIVPSLLKRLPSSTPAGTGAILTFLQALYCPNSCGSVAETTSGENSPNMSNVDLVTQATADNIEILTSGLIDELRTNEGVVFSEPYWNGLAKMLTWLPPATAVDLGTEIVALTRWNTDLPTCYLILMSICLQKASYQIAQDRETRQCHQLEEVCREGEEADKGDYKLTVPDNEDGENGELYLTERVLADVVLPKVQAVPIADIADPERVSWAMCCVYHALYIHTTQKQGFLSRFHQCWPGLHMAATHRTSSWLGLNGCLKVLSDVASRYGGDFVSHRIKNELSPRLESAFIRMALHICTNADNGSDPDSAVYRSCVLLTDFFMSTYTKSQPVSKGIGMPLACLMVAQHTLSRELELRAFDLAKLMCAHDPYAAGRMTHILESPKLDRTTVEALINDSELLRNGYDCLKVSVSAEKARAWAARIKSTLWGLIGIGM